VKVLRIASVFETNRVDGRAARLDPVGGLQHHASQLTRALDALGVEQHVVTAYRPGCPRVEVAGEAATVHRFGAPVRRCRQLYAAAALRAVPALAAGCHLVHAHLGEDLAVLPLAVRTARRAGAPLVVTVHCSPTHTVAVTGGRSALIHHLGGWMEGRATARADGVITLTEQMAIRLTSAGLAADRVSVIPSGADHRRFGGHLRDPWPELPRPRVLYLGRLVPQKGVDVLLDAVRHLAGKVPVLVVGDGPLRLALERRARRLGIADRVRFEGFCRHVDVPARLAHADVIVVPSVYEELGSVLIEALHAGLPAVASDVGGIPTVVRDGVTGDLVPPGSAPALARAIDRLVVDEDRRRRYRDASMAAAERYRWEVLAERVVEVYQRAMAQRRPVPR
jgi:glycogen(starch) synthase